MNAPTPVSALNILARPEQSASPKGSANEGEASFSNTLNQQKKALAGNEKQHDTARAQAPKNEAPEQKSANQHDSTANKSDSQEPDRAAQNDKNDANTTSVAQGGEKQDADRHQQETKEQLPSNATQPKASIESVIHGLTPLAREATAAEINTRDVKRAQENSLATTGNIVKERASANNISVERPDLGSNKALHASTLTTHESLKAANETQASNKSTQDTGLLSTQTARPLAGAAIVKANEHGNTARLTLLNDQPGSTKAKGAGLQKIEATFTRSDNTAIFLDRVVEARRISGQQLLQNAQRNDAAAAAIDRSAAGADAISGMLMATPQNTAFSLGSATVPTPMGHANWARDFSQQVSSFSQHFRSGLQTIELRLDPPDLGPIRISLSMSDNVAQASFVSPHAAVRQAVEQALPQLQEQLAQAGISLGQTSVGDQHQQNAQHAAMQGSQTRASSSAADTDNTEDAVTPPVSAQRSHNGQVDTFA